jgi:hypothetical protein
MPRRSLKLPKAWNFNAELVPSRTDRDGRIVVVRNLEPKSEGMKP